MSHAAPLALTLGEPAGIGPEIVAKAWIGSDKSDRPFVVVGDLETLRAQGVACRSVTACADAASVFPHAVPVLDRPLALPVRPGDPATDNAGCVTDWIEEAVSLAVSGDAAGVVTAPIAKAPLYQAGFGFAGHTEFIAQLTADVPFADPRGPVMMLTARDLRACLVTIHAPLSQVSSLITAERVIATAEVAAASLRRDFGISKPRLALAGLNPHAGESGAIGVEEVEVLEPAAAALRARGVDITDPKPADTLFHDAARAAYDAVICLYHDQALIPVKTLDFWGGVNATLGLPIIRTSPDHGTGFDIAGMGVARPDSLIAALKLAGEMADTRARRA